MDNIIQIPAQSKYMLNLPGVSVDVRPFLFIALSVVDNDKSYIRKKYEEKKWTYFEAYRKSPYSKNQDLMCYPTEVEENIRMLIGIYEVSEQTGDFTVLLSIIKNQYKDLYRYVDTRTVFDEIEFNTYMQKKSKEKLPNARKYMYSLYVATFLCHHFRKNLSVSQHALTSMVGIANTPNTPQQREDEWELNHNDIQEKVRELSAMHYLPIPSNNFRLWEYIAEQMYEVDNRPGEKASFVEIANIQTRLNSFVSFGDVIESLGIDPIELQNISLPPEEMRRILQEFVIQLEEHPETNIDFNVFFSVYYNLRRLAFMYQDAKRRLLDTSEEEKFIFAKEKEQEIKERERRLEQVESESKLRAKQQKEKNEELQKELIALQKKERAWEKEKLEQEKNKKELSALRTFLYRTEQDTETEVVVPDEQSQHMMETIQRKRIVFFGGHPNWIQRTKEHFPDARFLEVDDINRKLSFIQNYDVVCINADYFNHGFYAKLMNEISKYSAKLVYVRGATNQERLVKEIYEQLNQT